MLQSAFSAAQEYDASFTRAAVPVAALIFSNLRLRYIANDARMNRFDESDARDHVFSSMRAIKPEMTTAPSSHSFNEDNADCAVRTMCNETLVAMRVPSSSWQHEQTMRDKMSALLRGHSFEECRNINAKSVGHYFKIYENLTKSCLYLYDRCFVRPIRRWISRPGTGTET